MWPNDHRPLSLLSRISPDLVIIVAGNLRWKWAGSKYSVILNCSLAQCSRLGKINFLTPMSKTIYPYTVQAVSGSISFTKCLMLKMFLKRDPIFSYQFDNNIFWPGQSSQLEKLSTSDRIFFHYREFWAAYWNFLPMSDSYWGSVSGQDLSASVRLDNFWKLHQLNRKTVTISLMPPVSANSENIWT